MRQKMGTVKPLNLRQMMGMVNRVKLVKLNEEW
jgi:hypothetical protein